MKVASPHLSDLSRRLGRALAGLCILLAFPSWISAAAAQAARTTTADGGSYLRHEDYRVAAIAHRLGRAGKGLCPTPFPLTGMLLQHLPEYGPADRPEAIRLYGLDRGPSVLAIAPASAAARSGVLAGDVLLAINGIALPSPREMAAQRRDADWRKGIAATDSLIEDQLRRGSAALRLLREGREATLTLAADMACPARARLARSTQKNAFADGRYVIMTTAMLPFFHSDDEAAVAMAHELAHNILGHPQRLKQQGVATGFFRHFGKNASRIRATEVEADRLSIRLLAAAGYDLTAVIPFWTRLERGFGGRFQINTTHPGVRARTRMLKEEIDRLSGAAPPPVPSGR